MNTINLPNALRMTTMACAILMLSACAASAVKNPGAAKVRADLTALKSDPKLASAAPLSMQEAEKLVSDAEIAEKDNALSSHRVYLADRKVQTTRSLAQAQYAESQRQALSDMSDKVRLDSRTREADGAKLDARIATADATAAKSKNDQLLAELADLKAKKTERGIEMTLGDVLFASGRAELKPGAAINLDKLVTALRNTTVGTVSIEGFTDSQGSDDMNLSLSQRRADAVSMYLTGNGVARDRLSAIGKGESFPVAGNDTAAGRQLNRRVVVTIQNPTP